MQDKRMFKQFFHFIIIFVLCFNMCNGFLFTKNNVGAEKNPQGILLITDLSGYETAGFNLSNIDFEPFVYTSDSLIDFYMPIALKKEDVSSLRDSDISHTIYHGNTVFNNRFQYIEFNIYESDTYYIVLYHMKVKASNNSFSIDFVPKIKGEELSQFAWWNSNWDYYTPIVTNATQTSDDLTNFPILVNCTDAVLIAKCKTYGEDIRFVTDDNLTEYYYEIDKWTANNFNIWVNITSLLSAGTSFNMYYGNAAASNSSSSSTWNTNYIFVAHLNASTTKTSGCYDSSTYANHATYYGSLPTNVDSKIGGGQEFDGVNDWIDFPDGCWLDSGAAAEFGTYESWYESDSPSASMVGFFQRDTDGGIDTLDSAYWGYTGDGHRVSMETSQDAIWNTVYVDSAGVTSANWAYITLQMYEDDTKLKLDSLALYVDIDCKMPSETVAKKLVLRFGADHADNRDIDGEVDELRISDIRRSDAWIETSYNTMNNCSTFCLFGTEEVYSAPSAPEFSNEHPDNNSGLNPIAFTWNITIVDTDADTFNWTITCNDTQSSSGNVETDGNKTLSLSGLSYSTEYTIWVNATDQTFWTNETFYFVTDSAYTGGTVGYMWVSISGVRAVGTKPADIKLNDNNYIVAEFSDNAEEYIQANLKIPHDMNLSQICGFYIGWSTPVTDKIVDWEIHYLITGLNDNTEQAGITIQNYGTSSSNADGLMLTKLVDLYGGTLNSTTLAMHIQVMRDGNDASDTINDIVEVHGIALKYIIAENFLNNDYDKEYIEVGDDTIFEATQFTIFIGIMLFFFFFWIGYTSQKRSGGSFMILSGLMLLALEIPLSIYLSATLVIPLFSPFAIYIIILGIKKQFYSMDKETKTSD